MKSRAMKSLRIITLLHVLLNIFTLRAQNNEGFLNADSLFCHDSLNYLSSFHDDEVLIQFERSKFKSIKSIDSTIEINSETITCRTPAGHYLSIWMKKKNFFIRNGDTTYSINNKSLTKRIGKRKFANQSINLLKGGFTLIPIGGLTVYISKSNNFTDKIFFELENQSVVFEFLSSRGVDELEKMSIHHNNGELIVFYNSTTLKPYIVNSIPLNGTSIYSLSFNKRNCIIEDVREFIKASEIEENNAPDIKMKFYYDYNRKGLLYKGYGIKVNVCK